VITYRDKFNIMTNKKIIEGLQILDKYCIEGSNKDCFKLNAYKDELRFDPTDIEIESEDLKELIKLGWGQKKLGSALLTPLNQMRETLNWQIQDYDPKLGWSLIKYNFGGVTFTQMMKLKESLRD
jgi:hypothetical protein